MSIDAYDIDQACEVIGEYLEKTVPGVPNQTTFENALDTLLDALDMYDQRTEKIDPTEWAVVLDAGQAQAFFCNFDEAEKYVKKNRLEKYNNPIVTMDKWLE